MARFGQFVGYQSLRTTFYLKAGARVMSFAAYWRPETAITGFTAAMATTHAQGFYALFAPLLAELMQETSTIEKCKAEWYGQAGDGYYDGFSTGAATPGEIEDVDGVGDVMPDITALVIQRRTGKSDRESRGRVFIPCLAEETNNNGFLNPDYFTAANAIAAALATSHTISAVQWNARHWNRKENELEVVTSARVIQVLSHRNDRKVRGIYLPT